ncbi:hypothetical protein [Pseudanabaena sp. BC1403]|uniref:hypothetical protein n=1 Tax=Pseudanabaena sp. BC1403 TaxID=2043171 RepID=UPI000CD9326F|nr:hypothetical protein [Pseudanabaena sp. BC1403]
MSGKETKNSDRKERSFHYDRNFGIFSAAGVENSKIGFAAIPSTAGLHQTQFLAMKIYDKG